MKDAKGHGSDSRGNTVFGTAFKNAGTLTGVRMSNDFRSSGRALAPQQRTDTQRTVADLRSRMNSTGPGHQTGLWQGIKNLVGG